MRWRIRPTGLDYGRSWCLLPLGAILFVGSVQYGPLLAMSAPCLEIRLPVAGFEASASSSRSKSGASIPVCLSRAWSLSLAQTR